MPSSALLVGGKWIQNIGFDSSNVPIIDYSFQGGKWGYIRSPLTGL
ncbi:MAG: hypothetical protein KME23_23175 [Goleter apudmare HA4340-LM2]|nr:hypothetical protein [Goleter apudmare HA4340-LM2]